MDKQALHVLARRSHVVIMIRTLSVTPDHIAVQGSGKGREGKERKGKGRGPS
jgi:hypothetical protein